MTGKAFTCEETSFLGSHSHSWLNSITICQFLVDIISKKDLTWASLGIYVYTVVVYWTEYTISFSALAAAAVEEEKDPLDRTGFFCGGLIEDIKRRTKFYLSDFRDGFNMQCLLTSIFLYFSVFAPNVAFGSILHKKTAGWLGVSEVIYATCLCGVLFGLFAGQPLIIIGATGPVLVFEQTIYEVSWYLSKQINEYKILAELQRAKCASEASCICQKIWLCHLHPLSI